MTKVVKSNLSTKAVSNKFNSTGMNTSSFRYHKTPTPATNGTQKVFTVPGSEEYSSGLLEVFVDGLLQTKDVDYTETTSSTFTMTNAPDANETLRINYIKQ